MNIITLQKLSTARCYKNYSSNKTAVLKGISSFVRMSEDVKLEAYKVVNMLN